MSNCPNCNAIDHGVGWMLYAEEPIEVVFCPLHKAAADLLSTLEEMTARYESLEKRYFNKIREQSTYPNGTIERARALITKAKGQS